MMRSIQGGSPDVRDREEDKGCDRGFSPDDKGRQQQNPEAARLLLLFLASGMRLEVRERRR
jgi:hypothetical protein